MSHNPCNIPLLLRVGCPVSPLQAVWRIIRRLFKTLEELNNNREVLKNANNPGGGQTLKQDAWVTMVYFAGLTHLFPFILNRQGLWASFPAYWQPTRELEMMSYPSDRLEWSDGWLSSIHILSPNSEIPECWVEIPNAWDKMPGPAVSFGRSLLIFRLWSIISIPSIGSMPRISTAWGTPFTLVTTLNRWCIP